VISEEAFEELTAEVDAQLSEGYQTLPESGESRVQFLEVIIPPNSNAAGKAISELALPRAAVLVSIRREEEILIPRGNTELQSGDVVTTLCERESVAEVRELLLTPNNALH
jgi:trk system potassium uptake protein TrkA